MRYSEGNLNRLEIAGELLGRRLGRHIAGGDLLQQLLYFRAISYERNKQWPEAETDFKHALQLFPDQPDATVAAPSASSRMRSQPMIHATSSPRLA